MVNQIADIFPQTPRSTIQDILRQAGSVSVAGKILVIWSICSLVEMLLENRQNAQNAATLAQNNEINQALNLDESASDSASESGSDNVDESANNLTEFENPLNTLKNEWLNLKLSEMIELNRRFVSNFFVIIQISESISNRLELVI
jgi:hypothetical protein